LNDPPTPRFWPEIIADLKFIQGITNWITMALVLVVDDELEIRLLLRLILERAGHRILDAADGLSALSLCEGQCPDLVYCDIFMPGMEGLETMRRIRKLYPRAKIIAMSGGAKAVCMDFLPVAEAMAANLVMPKPLVKEKILRAAEQLLNGKCLEPQAELDAGCSLRE
jgi:CheY-like chemotaxis protein